MASSMLPTGWMQKSPASTATRISGLSMRLATLSLGMSTPCLPVRPRRRQTSKKPSILRLTPPTAMMAPDWLTAPVKA